MHTKPLHLALLLASALLLGNTSSSTAERPSAPKMLPEKTLAYLRIENVPELIEKFRDTAMGRITADEQVKPLVSDLYKSAMEAFSRIEDRVGVPLDELLRIPQGEVCVAVVAPEEGRPQLAAVVEVGDQLGVAERLLDRLDEQLVANGVARTVENIGDIELQIYQFPGDRSRQLTVCVKEQTLLATSNLELAKQLLQVWEGDETMVTLAENRAFVSIMKRCSGTEDERPQISFYVDPIEFAKRVSRGNFSAQAGLATLSALGVDGIKGVGGSVIMATEEFDSIMHAHVLLAAPRDGVVEMIALDSGDTTPEPWVPKDVVSYTTVNWDIATSLAELTRLYEIFRGEGAWQQEIIERVSGQLDVDFEQEFINQIAGRLSMVTWIERPARINSQTTLIAVKLNDAKAFARTMEQIASRFEGRLSKQSYGGVTYYRVATGNRNRELSAEQAQFARIPEPCIAVLDDYVLATDSTKFLQQAIITKNDSSASLARELDFKLIANKIQRRLGDTKAGLMAFNRPEESMRAMYELATSQDMRSRLASRADRNGFFRALNSALDANPLPPFAVLAKYLAPGGAMMTNDETGLHYTAFTLRRD